MLVKSRKSSFNSNIGEFCYVIFVFVSVFFYGALNYLDIFQILRHMRLSALRE